MNRNLHKNFLLFIICLTFRHISPEDPSPNCLDLISKMRNCRRKISVPETCDKPKKSKILVCAEEIAKKLPTCNNEVAQKLLKNYVTTYKLSDKLICQKNLHSELMNNHKCIPLVEVIVSAFGLAAPGFFSVKGCKYVKTALYMNALSLTKLGCYQVVEDFIDVMYTNSPCREIKVDTPKYKDLEDFLRVVTKLVNCWFTYTDFPKCGEEKSKRLFCVENVSTSDIENPHLHFIAENFLSITKTTDDVICRDKTLKEDFLQSPDCWKGIRMEGLQMIDQVNGFFSKDGCESLKFRTKNTASSFGKSCHNLLDKYRKAVNKLLPCHVEDPVSKAGKFDNLVTLTLIVVLKLSTEILSAINL